MSTAQQDKRLENMSKYGEVTVEQARASIENQIKVDNILADLPAARARGDAISVKTEFKSAPAGAKYEKPQISAVAAKAYAEKNTPYQTPENRSMGALNVNYVVQSATTRGVTPDNYIASLRDTLAELGKGGGFTGAWGNDRVTNSLDEYAGWVKQAEAMAAAAKYEAVAKAE